MQERECERDENKSWAWPIKIFYLTAAPRLRFDSTRAALEPPFSPRPHTDAGGLFNYDREVETLDRWKHIAFITCRQPPPSLSGNRCVRQLVRVYPCPRQLRFRYARTHAPCLTDPWPWSGVRRRSGPVSRAERERESREIKINTTPQSDLTRVVHKIWLIGWKCLPSRPQLAPLSHSGETHVTFRLKTSVRH